MLKKITLSKFTAFESATLEFSRGVNVFVGANATGKTHVMKLAYSVLRASRELEKQENSPARKANTALAGRLATKLAAVFQPGGGALGSLVRTGRGRNKSTIEVELDGGTVAFSLSSTRENRRQAIQFRTSPCQHIPSRQRSSFDLPGIHRGLSKSRACLR